MGIGSLGFTELVAIFIIVLVFFGPRRFPEIARSMGSAMREFRRSLNQIQRELEEVDPRKDLPGKDILDDIRSGKPGNWLDPKKTAVPSAATPGSRSMPEAPGPEVTGEAVAGAATVAPVPVTPAAIRGPDAAEPGEQLPIFEGTGEEAEPPADSGSSEPPAPDDGPTDGSRSD